MEIQGITLLYDIGLIILASTFFAFFARALKQPLILAYVVAGILIGPYGFGLITEKEIIKILAELGIAFLLFIVGLELDTKRLKDLGKVSIGCGLGQIIITSIFGFTVARILGFSQLESFYIGFLLTISSTMVVIKLLSDKHELDTLHGKIALGILLVQDIASIMFLATLPTISKFSISILTASIIGGLGLVFIAIFTNKFLLPKLVKFVSKPKEFLFLFALSWCFLFSLFSYFVFLNLLRFEIPPIAIGSFLGGVSLAIFPYNFEIISRVKSLKDFFAAIFFASLGMQVPLRISLIREVIILSIFVLIFASVIMFVIARFFGYGKRTSFLIGISLAQISEFSLIISNQGLLLGHLSQEIFLLIMWIALITITISSYFITHSYKIYKIFLPFIEVFDRFLEKFFRTKEIEEFSSMLSELSSHDDEKHIILFGSHRTGYSVIKTLQRLKKNFLVVDHNPDVVKELISQGVNCIYGDILDIELLERAGLKDAKIVISTVPNQKDNIFLIRQLKKLNSNTFTIIRAESFDDALELYREKVDYVIFPEMLAGEKISDFLEEYLKNEKVGDNIKEKDMRKLEKIKEEELLMRYEPSSSKYWRRGF